MAGIDQTAVAQFRPRLEIEWAAVALQNGAFRPTQAEPAQVLAQRLTELRTATVAIEVLDAQAERAAARAAALLGAPESKRVAGVKVTGRRGRETPAIGNCRLQISDFRLKSQFRNLQF